MTPPQLDGKAELNTADRERPAGEAETFEASQDDRAALLATAATVGVVGVGVAIFEAALLPGLVLGVAAILVPKNLPRMGSALSPLFRSTVRGVYKGGQKVREMVAEAQEQVHDIVAEVNAEEDAKKGGPKKPAGSSAPPNA
jgi:hypothetical protein